MGGSLCMICMPKTGCALSGLFCPMSTLLLTSRAGCCVAARMPRRSPKKHYFELAASFAVFTVEMRALGCCRSCAILATRG